MVKTFPTIIMITIHKDFFIFTFITRFCKTCNFFLLASDMTREAPKPGGPLTNRQPTENSWISGNPIPHCYVPFTRTHNFNKNRTKSSLYGEFYPKYNLYKT